MIELDGSMGEGGGQILRTALSLALITGTPFLLRNIRARRSKPGLQPQHLAAVRAASAIGQARVEGDAVGSATLRFEPGKVVPGEYTFDIGTAGSAGLVLQTVHLPLALAGAPSRVSIRGGTHVPWSPNAHYLDWHWRPFMARLGLDVRLDMERAGFYPMGGGLLHADIPASSSIHPLRLADRGPLMAIRGLSLVARLPSSIAERQRDQTIVRLAGQGLTAHLELGELAADSPGTVIILMAEYEHSQACFTALGARGKRAETVADEAVDELFAFHASDAALDDYLADQLMLPLALAHGKSIYRARITPHAQTNAVVIRAFLDIPMELDGTTGKVGAYRFSAGNEGISSTAAA